MLNQSRLVYALPCFFIVILNGCTHNSSTVDAPLDQVKPVSELNIDDPDPADKDDKTPAFCNPTDLQGAALRQCYEHNDTLYKDVNEESKKREPWFNFAPDNWLQAKELDQQFVFPVLHEDEAVGKLNHTAIIELSPAEAGHFTGKPQRFAGRRPYLSRALVYFKATGNFAVFEQDQEIFIRHDSVGPSSPGEKHSAVVVYLEFKPKEVYIDCQLTE